MTSRAPLAIAALLVLGCGPKNSPVVPSGNNDGPDAECRRDSDCEDFHVCNRDDECEPGPCLDGEQSFGETDVDCGGSTCGACPLDAACQFGRDCESGTCTLGVCANDGANNGTDNNGANNGGPGFECEDTGGAERFTLWDSGIDFEPGHRGRQSTTGATTTGGIAAFDYDADGDVDVMVTSEGGTLALFQNDGSGAFSDVTQAANLDGLTYTTGLSVADLDADADLDVWVGRSIEGSFLLLNQGDGTFRESGAQWGLPVEDAGSAGGTFGDFDGDGDLDLYQANYFGPFDPDDPLNPPGPTSNRLLRNDGDRFTLVTEEATPGFGETRGSTLAAAWWDYDQDGDPDLWVGNDFGMRWNPNQLWRNDGPDPNDANGWSFVDVAPDVGLDAKIFSMSTTLADFDNDGDQDGYVSNLARNVLHVWEGSSATEQAVQRGVAVSDFHDPRPAPTEPPMYSSPEQGMDEFFENYSDPNSEHYTLTSFGSFFFDANLDGWQDMFVVNGSVSTTLVPEGTFQPNRVLMSTRDGNFEEAPCWFTPDIRGTSRGAAYADFDRDGDLDVVFADQGDYGEAQVVLLRNELDVGNYIVVELEGLSPNTQAIGAKVTLVTAGGTQTRWIDGGQGYMSVSERVAHFGLGEADAVESLEVSWPDGTSQTVSVDAVNQRIVVAQQPPPT